MARPPNVAGPVVVGRRTAHRGAGALARLPLARHPLRLHGVAAHPRGAGGVAQGGAEVRHHDDLVLLRPPLCEAGAEFRHAALAGLAVHRAGQTGDERSRLLQPAVRSRRRARRADEGLSARPSASFRHGRLLTCLGANAATRESCDGQFKQPRHARDPQDLAKLLVARQLAGDAEGMAALYEPEAILDGGDGRG